MKMKKVSSMILTAAILLTTACSDNNTSSVNSQNSTIGNSSGGVTDNSTSNMVVENTPNKVDDTLPQCQPANLPSASSAFTKCVMMGDSGYYYKDWWQVDEESFSSGIVYYDNATGMSIPLCAKPQCMHDGNIFCAASSFDSEYDVLYNGYIYRLGYHTTETEYTIRLLRSDLQGNELSKVTDVHKGLLGDDGERPLIKSVVFHYGKMFLTVTGFSGGDDYGTSIYMTDLGTGENKTIQIAEKGKDIVRMINDVCPFLTCDGDWLYYTTRDVKWDDTKIYNEQHMSYNRTVMYRYNLKSGQTEIIPAMPDIYSSFTVNNSIIYYTVADRKNNTFSLYSYDIAKDKTTTFAENIKQEFVEGKYVSDYVKITVTTDRKYLYVCTVGVSGSSSLKNTGDTDFYIYDFEGNQLLQGLPGTETLFDIEKEWSYSFFALDGEIYLNYQDGSDSSGDSDKNEMSGMYTIKTEDLINGKTNWTKLYKAIN